MANDRIEFKCSKCGSGQFRMPKKPRPSDTIECAGCGASARYDEVRKAAKEAKKHVEDIFKKAFRKR